MPLCVLGWRPGGTQAGFASDNRIPLDAERMVLSAIATAESITPRNGMRL